jgi:hypothetical protein
MDTSGKIDSIEDSLNKSSLPSSSIKRQYLIKIVNLLNKTSAFHNIVLFKSIGLNYVASSKASNKYIENKLSFRITGYVSIPSITNWI